MRVKNYDVDSFRFEFVPEGDPFKGKLTTRYPELRAYVDHVNLGSRSSRKRYARSAGEDVGMSAELLTAALAQVATKRSEEVAAAAEEQEGMGKDEAFMQFVAQLTDIFHTTDEVCYVSYGVADHIETWPTSSYRFEQRLRGIYYAETGASIDPSDLNRGIETLKAKTLHEGRVREVFRRVAMHNGNLYIDLGDPDWRVIRIGRDGWEVIPESPVKFIRNRTTLSLPTPQKGGSVAAFREFLNIGENDFKLVIGWILGAFNPDGPYPLIELTGRQGTAKSTAARLLISLVDPKTAPLRALPTNERDLAISASNVHVLAFDNVSYIRPDLSDAICRVSTGGGLATRRLYTDDEEVIFDIKRPIILNGINELAVRGDLQERSIQVTLLPISEVDRRPERELWAGFEEARPFIMGAVLDSLVSVLKHYDSVELDSTPRMADFTRWVTAAEESLGWQSGEFAKIYFERLRSASVDAMDTNPVVGAIRELLDKNQDGEWSGTCASLLNQLNYLADDAVQRQRAWPKASNSLSRHLRRIAPQLEAIGIEYSEDEEGHDKRKIKHLRYIGEGASDEGSEETNTD